MKKFMALLLVAGMTLSLTACGGSTDTAKTDQADGKDTFTVGFDQDFPPFGYVGMMANLQGLTLRWRRSVQRVWAKDCVTADRLGCKGYGVRSRYDRLYLEWIYDEWT